MAGPIRLSRLRSGPTAKGISVTRIRKKTRPIAAPPPMRRAMRHSRRKSAAAAFLMARPRAAIRARSRDRAAHGWRRRSARRRRDAREGFHATAVARLDRAPSAARREAKAGARRAAAAPERHAAFDLPRAPEPANRSHG